MQMPSTHQAFVSFTPSWKQVKSRRSKSTDSSCHSLVKSSVYLYRALLYIACAETLLPFCRNSARAPSATFTTD